ncbi:Fic/DOC family protein [Labedella gwakjiensis]|uniref:Fic/DOC family protein n=1 Tax=Labedella gwakjiensis TaxID=390269 RepID=A0A2P8GU25_9MICO|nr:Fic family protein [Labedella gwakjiensis]PSL37467.1 Fic/DOC family protein [Labedella gwakjiensis]
MTETNGWGDGLNAYVRRPGRPEGSRPLADKTPEVPARSTAGAESFAATGIRWDASRIDFERIAMSSTSRARFRFEKSLPDLVWNAAALEGNTFTLPEVRTLLDGVTVGGRRIEEEKQVLALVDGYSRLDDLVGAGRFALTKAVSDDLHGRVATHEAIESGAFRGEGPTGGGGNVLLASGGIVAGVPQEELQARFTDTVDFLDTLDDARERALAYFAAATRAQFYFDGNKRTARLMMSGILMADGYEVVNIPFARQFEFNKALDVLFTDDDATSLMGFIADCAIDERP